MVQRKALSMLNKAHILITGATGGIGCNLCHYLSELGYNLTITARNEKNLYKLKLDLETKYNNKVNYFLLDFASEEDLTEKISYLKKEQARFSGAVIMPPQPSRSHRTDTSLDKWKSLFTLSFIHPLYFIEQLSSLFINKSKLVCILGISSIQVLDNYSQASAIRAAWRAQIKSLAHQWGHKGIHINGISFGGVLTTEYKKSIQERALKHKRTFDEQMDYETSNVPLQKYATTQEAAHIIAGLLSNISDHMTGQNIICDGGFIKSF